MAVPLAVLISCGGGDEVDGRSFEEALQGGASCADLFEIRNEVDPHSPLIEQWNEQLREIGCYSSSSTGTDR